MSLTLSLISLFFPSLLFFQSFPLFFRRLSLLFLSFEFFSSLSLYSFSPQSTIVFWDGQISLTPDSLLIQLILIVFAFLILYSFEFNSVVILYLFTNLFGLILLISSEDFILLLLSWEIINISTYLIVTSHSSFFSAGIKYFYLSALNTSFLLIGIFFFYADLGNLNFAAFWSSESWIALFFIYLALFFKLSAFPFYLWAPDLYGSLKWNLNAWLMILPKIAFGFLLNKLSLNLNPSLLNSLFQLIFICALFSILIGSIQLNSQYLIRRFIAYSSISHIGYILLAIFDSPILILTLVIYSFTLFGLLLILSYYPSLHIAGLNTIFKTSPFIGFSLGLLFFSFTGIPPLLGFYSKFYILSLVWQQLNFLGSVCLVVILLCSVISALRYLFIIKNITYDYKKGVSRFDHGPALLISFIVLWTISGAILIG